MQSNVGHAPVALLRAALEDTGHVRGPNDALAYQESDGQFGVVARRSHGHRDLIPAQPDLQRLLGGQHVGRFARHAVADPEDAGAFAREAPNAPAR